MPVCGEKQRDQFLIQRFRHRIEVYGVCQLGHEFLALIISRNVCVFGNQSYELFALMAFAQAGDRPTGGR